MDVSIGIATGLIGLTAFTVCLIWLGLNSVKNISIEIPARLLFFLSIKLPQGETATSSL